MEQIRLDSLSTQSSMDALAAIVKSVTSQSKRETPKKIPTQNTDPSASVDRNSDPYLTLTKTPSIYRSSKSCR